MTKVFPLFGLNSFNQKEYIKIIFLNKNKKGDILRDHSMTDSFIYALNGIWVSIKDERNLKIHMIVMMLVIMAGFLLNISITEWIICIILFALVISAEMINTAIENAIDYTREMTVDKDNELAGIAKDVSAGAVLVLAIASAIVGLIIFIPKVLLLL